MTDPVDSTRPSRIKRPAAKLTDANNLQQAALSFQRTAVEAEKLRLQPVAETSYATSLPQSSPAASSTRPSSPAVTEHSPEPPIHAGNKRSIDDDIEEGTKKKHKQSKQHIILSDDEGESCIQTKDNPKADAVMDQDGMYHDVTVLDIGDESEKKKPDPTADVKHFFGEPFSLDTHGKKKHRFCKICKKRHPGDASGLGDDCTSLRRHMQAYHRAEYEKWAKSVGFESMLPKDSLARRQAAVDEAARVQQGRVDQHFETAKAEDKSYSDGLFREAAIQWLVETDQPIQALEHPSFQNMVRIAARATRGVKFPNRQQTRAEIVSLFKAQMHSLKARLNSKIVSGEINLTCDAWQASNTDSYFAVTGHWIEEAEPNKWELQSALFGFTHMNTAHNGKRLGQALFKICDRLGIVAWIGHVTCDNASNNNTMMHEFGKRYHGKVGKMFDVKRGHIRCLAHIINLATQALISTRSKAKYYNPHDVEEHVPKTSSSERDELGLVRAIVVKARSSSQRKELFMAIQRRASVKPLQLLLDMKVRWGSTHVMIRRAISRRLNVDTFVYEMGIIAEEESLEKRRKIDALRLSSAEWDRLSTFADLLAVAETAQQSFSSEKNPTLFNAIPALEKMYSKWDKLRETSDTKPFRAALDAGLAKVNEYYEKTAESDAHVMAMLLHPRRKLKYFKKNWSDDLVRDVKELAETIFKQRYEQMHLKTSSGQCVNRVDDSSDEDSDTEIDPSRPWLVEFNSYFRTHEIVPEGMSIVTWWGLNYNRYPVWGSLPRDYLSIMASSVSSERAFSSAGITLSKRRNRLQADIIEALQFLKCLFHHDLIFREVRTVTDEEILLDEGLEESDDGACEKDDELSWKDIWIDANDIAESDTEM